MAKTPECNIRAISKYNKEKTVNCNIRMNIGTDSDIIAHLDAISEGKATYIKRLIREDIERLQK